MKPSPEYMIEEQPGGTYKIYEQYPIPSIYRTLLGTGEDFDDAKALVDSELYREQIGLHILVVRTYSERRTEIWGNAAP